MAAPYDIGLKRQEFFNNRRADIERGAKAQGQEMGDALTRRFTAIGQASSGAAMQAQLKAQDQVTQQANQQRNELAGQELQAMEPEAQRQFQAGLADKDQAFKQRLFDVEQGNKLQEIDLAKKQFELDRDTTEFNKRMAEIEANRKPPGMLDNLIPGLSPSEIMNPGANPGGIAGTVKKIIPNIPGVTSIPGLGGGGGGCFLTTAAVEVMGLSDDCWVLELARGFRDSYMAQSLERADEIREYYEMAPKIVEGINKKPDAKRLWKSFFWKDIVPFVKAVDQKQNERAHELYKNLIAKAKEIGG